MEPNPTIQSLWISLIRAATRIEGAADAALKSAGLPPLGWYDALWEIEKAGEIRPLLLQDRLLLPQYGLSRLVDRMEKAGLVTKRSCEEDGRGHVLALTDQGREVRARMWPVYAGVLAEKVEAPLDPEMAATVAEGLRRLAAASAPDPG